MHDNAAPIFSVIIPTYNHAHFLHETLKSVVMQSIVSWEAVVINNYSSDDTIAVVKSFEDSRIRLDNFHNYGVIAASRNRGIVLARGRYLAFLDSDDKWHPDKLMHCLPYLEQGADLICHGLLRIGKAKGNLYCGPEKKATYDGLLDDGNCITPSATVVRKDLVESAGCFSENPNIITAEDYHLWIKLEKAGAVMKFTRKILGDYRMHSGNQSGTVMRHLNSVLVVVNEFMLKNHQGEPKSFLRYRRRIGLAYYGAGRSMQINGLPTKSWKFFILAVMYWPFYHKTYAAIMLSMIEQFYYLIKKETSRHWA